MEISSILSPNSTSKSELSINLTASGKLKKAMFSYAFELCSSKNSVPFGAYPWLSADYADSHHLRNSRWEMILIKTPVLRLSLSTLRT